MIQKWEGKMLSALKTIKLAWEKYESHLGQLTLLTLINYAITFIIFVPAALIFVIFLIVISGIGTTSIANLPFANLGFLIGLILIVILVFVFAVIIGSYFNAVIMWAVLNTAQGKKWEIKDALKMGLKYFWKLIAANILVMLGVLGGLVLLIVPGIIFMVWWMFTAMVVVDEDETALEAINRSKQLVEGVWWETALLLAIIGSVSGILSECQVVPGIGWLISIMTLLFLAPFTTVIIATRYLELKKGSDRELNAAIKTIIVVLMALVVSSFLGSVFTQAGWVRKPAFNPSNKIKNIISPWLQ